MSLYQSILFLIFGLVGIAMILDENVTEYIYLNIKLLEIKIKTSFLLIKLHPRNPLTNWQMERRMKKLSKELSQRQDNV